MARRSIPTGLGISSLLVIFGVLCLCVFALLSASTVQSQQRLSRQGTQAVTGYYRADAQAQEILARLRTGQVPPAVREENGLYSYCCAVSETQVLQVTVRLRGSEYEILRWQTVSAADWNPDDSLPVWDGNP